MKKKYCLWLFFVLIGIQYLFAQSIPPSNYTDDKVNSVRILTPQIPFADPIELIKDNSIYHGLQSTQYTDGLGRSVQTVLKQLTPAKSDIVSMHTYDELGREPTEWLTFVSTLTGASTDIINNGNFKINPYQQQAVFMKNNYASQGETFFYKQQQFESSPLSRVIKTMPAGNSWVGASRGTVIDYGFNTALQEVVIWEINDAGLQVPISIGWYKPGQLSRIVITDERGFRVVTYKDKSGNEILKKVEISKGADITTHTGWLCTYSVYDDLDNLRMSITPKAVQQLAVQNWSFNGLSYALSPIASGLCYGYTYDFKHRLISKKNPGNKVVSIVYDAKDRIIMTQDGLLLAKNKWSVILYDAFDRVIQTGLWQNTTNKSIITLQTEASLSVTYPFTPKDATGLANWELMSENHYDDYTGMPVGLNSSIITSYNNYFITTAANTAPLYAQPLAQSLLVNNLLTWSRRKVVGSTNNFIPAFLYFVNIYDSKGRLIQVQSQNHTGGLDVSTTQYDFSGKALLIHQKNQKGGSNAAIYEQLTQMEYDHAGRILKIRKSFYKNQLAISTNKLIAQYDYNELGQLISKKLGTVQGGSDPLQTLNYTYNLRGWLLGINRDYIKGTSTNINTLFGLELAYDKPQSIISGTGYPNIQYNGNLSGQIWKSGGDGAVRKYDYTYDGADRFTGADFNQYSGSVFDRSAKVDYSVKNISYDANGNLGTMLQSGLKLNSSSPIDDLNYYYNDANNGNRLTGVLDVSNDPQSTLGDFNYATTKTGPTLDYTYDENGNTITDKNKGITNTTYNELNLPVQITVNKNGITNTINYVYDASGNKLQKIITNNAAVPVTYTTVNYLGNFVYEAQGSTGLDVLQFIGTEEGRIRYKSANGSQPESWVFDYYVKDQLENVRMLLTEDKPRIMYPPVSFEDDPATIQNEQKYYSNVDLQRTDRPGAFNTTVSNGTKVQLLRKNTSAIGAGAFIKVMAADKVNIKVDYYIPAATTDNSSANGTNSLISSLINLLNGPGAPALLKGSGLPITNSLKNSPPFNSFLLPQSTSLSSTQPKAYLNIIFFDEQFNFVQQNSQLVLANITGSPQQIVKINSDAPLAIKNGYVYIYVSNESNNLVYFDNLQVTHERGPILEENHYYPYGLKMAAISSAALPTPGGGTHFGYQGSFAESISDFGINENEFALRHYNPQIGRWTGSDPYDEFASGYLGMGNNPVNVVDPDGGCIFCETFAKSLTLEGVTVKATRFINKAVGEGFLSISSNFVSGVGSGALNGAIGLYNFGRYDAWQRDTWTGMAKSAAVFSIMQGSIGNQMTSRAAFTMIDETLGTNLNETATGISYAADKFVQDAPNMSSKQWGKLTGELGFALLGTKGAGVLKDLAFGAKLAKGAGIVAEGGTQGGLNLFKFGAEQTMEIKGWKTGDRMLKMFDQGSPKLNWKQNSGILRKEIGAGKPIYDSYLKADGNLQKTGGFLNSERYLLQSRGWNFNPGTGAWMPPN